MDLANVRSDEFRQIFKQSHNFLEVINNMNSNG